MSIYSGVISAKSQKLSEIAPNFGRFFALSNFVGGTYQKSSVRPECRCSTSHWSRTTRSYHRRFCGSCTGFMSRDALDYKLACFVFSSLSGHAPPYFAYNIHLVSEGPLTDRVPFHAHTTHSATGASLSLGYVFGTVFQPTCVTRTLHNNSFRRELKTFLFYCCFRGATRLFNCTI